MDHWCNTTSGILGPSMYESQTLRFIYRNVSCFRNAHFSLKHEIVNLHILRTFYSLINFYPIWKEIYASFTIYHLPFPQICVLQCIHITNLVIVCMNFVTSPLHCIYFCIKENMHNCNEHVAFNATIIIFYYDQIKNTAIN